MTDLTDTTRALQSTRPKRPRRRQLRLLALLLIVAATFGLTQAPADAAAGSDRLGPDEVIGSGTWIASSGATLRMQTDGNLVLYAAQNIAIWSSGTNAPGAYAVMQSDGNLVIYRPQGSSRVSVWSSNTPGRGRSSLVMQSDGNLVIYGPGGATWSTNTYRQVYAADQFPAYGWGADQWSCLNRLWIRESNWNERAKNGSSGAYGIPQSLPASKMASAGSDYLTNPFTQIRWGEGYISGPRYGNPCSAWNHETHYGWY